MADDFVQVQLDSTGKKVDTESLTVGAFSVHRQRLQIAGAAEDDVAVVTNAAPGLADYALTVRPITEAATATAFTSVAQNASSVLILASNTSRLMAMFMNDGDADLLLKLGTAATSTSYTVRIAPGGYYEMPRPIYTDQLDGIWVSAGSGDCVITEVT